MKIQAVSGMAPGAAAISGAKKAAKIQQGEDGSPARVPRPDRDKYIPEEKQEASGRYWLGRDRDGQPEIYFDDPGQPDNPSDAPAPARKDGKDKAERCTGSTDQVDREIERLKKRQNELKQQLGAQADGARREELERELARVERELAQKDNDTYRRRHTVFS